MLNIAILGLRHGASYLKEIARRPDTQVAALVDQNRELLDALCAREGVKGYETLEQLLAAEKPDVAIIALPTLFHAPATEACLAAGLHVLLEKPLCRDDDEAQRIATACTRSDKVVQVGYEVRSSELHQDILRVIASGEIGTLTNVWYNQFTHAHYDRTAWRGTRSEMGGLLFDCAVHYFDLIKQWAGSPPHRIAAIGNQLGKTGPCADDLVHSAAVALEYENGVRGNYSFCEECLSGSGAMFGLAGTRGTIIGDPYFPEGAGSYEIRSFGGKVRRSVVLDGRFNSKGHLGFSEQFDNFIATLNGEKENVCTVDDAVLIHRMMCAIDASIATGEVVTL